ncbi:hypothetical protein DO97_02305 [Neosynechococcus sphagnicola sy1]|uniref:Uncharacterized protein n=1 Tax=Neosynechococcus sphagnicola sy1 TaxID=1497020 RepID=A0A098TLH7_9CYAN|nr:hypothetical protein [Neosynechococcus sphagnicola]KGF73165.1 hypothetical protein DO97_02305 [Neosynechococcus sphagnicola sy1]
MARYTCLLTVAVPLNQLRKQLIEIFKSCRFDIVYETADYMMARETPGQVVFAKLVTAEVLIDQTTATETAVRMSLVVKNEELPLQTDNHCRQMFDLVHHTMAEYDRWQLLGRVIG